jgi:putative ABC transport system permease protein
VALPLNYSVRSVWVRRRTTVATVGGVALVVFILASSQMLAAGLQHTMRVAGKSDKAIVLQHSAYAEPSSRMNQSVLSVAASAPGVQKGPAGEPRVTGETVVNTLLPSVEDPQRIVSVLVRGVSANVLDLRPEVRVVAGRPPQSGADEAMVGARLAGRYEGLTLGGALELKAGRKIQVVGIFEAGSSSYESEVWADLDAVRTSLSWDGYLSSVTVKLASPSGFDDFAREVKLQSHDDAIAERESEYYSRISNRLSAVITGLGGLIAAVFSFGAMLGAAITMYSSVGQRTKEIGVFRALGFKRSHIMAALLLETTLLAGLGALVGMGLSALTSLVEFAAVNAATGAQIDLRFRPTVPIMLGSVLIGTLVGLIGGMFPALQAARINPLEAIRS